MDGNYLENKDSDEAQLALDVLGRDRIALAERVVSPWWYYPALGLATAAIVASPGAGTPAAQSLVVVGASVALVFSTLGYQKKTGLTFTRAAGPRGVLTLVGLLIAILALLGTSAVLVATDHSVWVALVSGAAFLLMVTVGFAYDRVFDSELRRGR